MVHDFYCEKDRPIVKTSGGRVRGYYLDGIFHFHGIPYAEAERYERPRPVTPWEGVRDAITYGHVAPTVLKPNCAGRMSLSTDPLFAYRYWPESEVCHYVNVWTKDISGSGEKKPVMVWIHGGGFSTGSSVEQNSYEPENLVRQGDVVVVSLNHRLNVLGYLNLSAYGEEFEESGNLGMMDIVEALKWVRENAASFGGDKDNVTLFGQSGGGGKILALMQMPVADSLYHKVIIQSAIKYPIVPKAKVVADSLAVADAVVKGLGLTRETISQIRTVPFDALRAAYVDAMPALRAQGVDTTFVPIPGEYYKGEAMDVGFTDKSKYTPCITGSCYSEHYLSMRTSQFYDFDMPEEEKLKFAREAMGEHADEMIALYKEAYPDKNWLNVCFLDGTMRRAILEHMEAKSKYGAPCYVYLLSYNFHSFSGMPVCHGMELPLVFNSTDRVPAFHEPTLQALGVKMSAAWAAFAHTGDPNNRYLPRWTQYTAEHPDTMVLDEYCEVRTNFDRALVDARFRNDPHVGFDMITPKR